MGTLLMHAKASAVLSAPTEEPPELWGASDGDLSHGFLTKRVASTLMGIASLSRIFTSQPYLHSPPRRATYLSLSWRNCRTSAYCSVKGPYRGCQEQGQLSVRIYPLWRFMGALSVCFSRNDVLTPCTTQLFTERTVKVSTVPPNQKRLT
jgi:hypothetical protein